MLKEISSGDFSKAWGGIAGLQFSLPVIWTAAKQQGFNLHHLMRWVCLNPATFLNLQNKGVIQKGADADLVVWNPEEIFTVKKENIYHKHRITPYLDRELFGVVKQTYVNGQIVYDNGRFVELNQGKVQLVR